jgi:hypothetical protein
VLRSKFVRMAKLYVDILQDLPGFEKKLPSATVVIRLVGSGRTRRSARGWASVTLACSCCSPPPPLPSLFFWAVLQDLDYLSRKEPESAPIQVVTAMVPKKCRYRSQRGGNLKPRNLLP